MNPTSADLQKILHQHFGLSAFRPGQEQAIRNVLEGNHTLLVMPTGAGKSLTYQLPALFLPGLVLVISPLIALMQDQVDSLANSRQAGNRDGLRATFINSSLPPAEQNQRLKAMREGHLNLVYVAPERLRSSRFTHALRNVKVSLLAVDEAHCVSQWGHDFRPDYLQIRSVWDRLGRPPLLATTATATPQVQGDILRLLGPEHAQRIVTGFNRPNLFFSVRYAPDDDTKLRLVEQVLEKDLIDADASASQSGRGRGRKVRSRGSAIVYVATRRSAEEVAAHVKKATGLAALPYHAGLDPDTRRKVQDDFMQDRLPIVVATNAFGMGVDKADIRAVIHYHTPATLEAYYQEAGRAGRDGQPAVCTLLFAPDDRRLQSWFIDSDTPTWVDLNQVLQTLKKKEQDGSVWVDLDDLSDKTGLHVVKLRVVLSEMEQAGALQHLGDERGFGRWQVMTSLPGALEKRAQAVAHRAEHRHKMLDRVIAYAESTQCRRRQLLEYFGDDSALDMALGQQPVPETLCCDNCSRRDVDPSRLPRAETAEEWIPLIVLETVRTLPRALGRVRLAQILNGSRAGDVTRMGYHRHKFYAKLSHLSQDQIVAVINALIEARFLAQGGDDPNRPVVRITAAGEIAVTHRAAIPLAVHVPGPKPGRTGRKSSGKSSTLDETLALFRKGVKPAQIAKKRDLQTRTIYNHLADLIERGDIQVEEIVSRNVIREVRAAANEVGVQYLNPIKERVSRSISYDEIKCVTAAIKREQGDVDSP